MKMIKNHVQMIGRLGANPEVKVLENGSKVARFPLAVTETFINKKGEKISDVQWHNVVAWNNMATIAERILSKGTQVTIDGKLVKRIYLNKEGWTCSTFELNANEFFVLQSQIKFA